MSFIVKIDQNYHFAVKTLKLVKNNLQGSNSLKYFL